MITLLPLKNFPIIRYEDNIADEIFNSIKENGIQLLENDVIIIAHTIVSRSEGRMIKLEDIEPSSISENISATTEKDPKVVEMILREAKGIVRIIPPHIITETSTMIFFIASNYWFEQDLYDAILRGEFLDCETICSYWIKNRDRIFGNSVKFDDSLMKFSWMPTPNHFMPNFRFYNYPYCYAQLFVFSLYQKYINEGNQFVLKYKKALSAGNSISPYEIGEIFGIDIDDPEFWKLGIKHYENYVDRLENLLKKNQ